MSKLERNCSLTGRGRRLGLWLVLGLLASGSVLMAQATATEDSGASGCPHCEHHGCPHHGCPHHGCAHRGRGPARGGGPGSGGRGAGCSQPVMENAHFLIDNHQNLQRTVENVPGGVKTRTVADDPGLTDRLREHVREMADLLEEGGRIRNWDPLFNEIFDHRDAIDIEIREIPDGVEVIETSEEEQVVALIRAHARKVEEFVARGRAACHEETPLPPEYSDTRR